MTDIDIDQQTVAESQNKQESNRNPDGTFKPGVSGNPAGRPVGTISIITRLKQKWAEDPRSFERYVEEIEKDPQMRKHVLDHVEGKPRQTVDANMTFPQFMIDIIKSHGITNEEGS